MSANPQDTAVSFVFKKEVAVNALLDQRGANKCESKAIFLIRESNQDGLLAITYYNQKKGHYNNIRLALQKDKTWATFRGEDPNALNLFKKNIEKISSEHELLKDPTVIENLKKAIEGQGFKFNQMILPQSTEASENYVPVSELGLYVKVPDV